MSPGDPLPFCITCGGALERTRGTHLFRPCVVLDDVEIARCISCRSTWLETPGLDALVASVEAFSGCRDGGDGTGAAGEEVRLKWDGERWRSA